MDHRRLDLPRARPPMRRGLKLITYHDGRRDLIAARAAPYEKGTESAVRYPDPPHCIASLQLTVLQDNSPLPPHTHDIRIRVFECRACAAVRGCYLVEQLTASWLYSASGPDTAPHFQSPSHRGPRARLSCNMRRWPPPQRSFSPLLIGGRARGADIGHVPLL